MEYNLGESIHYYRKRKNLTLKTLGELVGYAENSVWQWEKNQREPNIQTLLLLAKALEISIIELLGGRKMENGQYTLHGKEYSLYDEVKKYDGELPDWKIEEYITFKLRVMNWCEQNGYEYEHSSGRELLFIPIDNTEWGEERPGVLLEVPEHSHFESSDPYKECPIVFFSLGNEEDGYRVEANIQLSIFELEDTIKKYEITPSKKEIA